MTSVRLTISLPDSLANSLDKLRGDVPMSTYIQSILDPVVESRKQKYLKKVRINNEH